MSALDLLKQRFAALQSSDFDTVYSTYHTDSPFIQQFSSRGNYIRFSEQNLSSIDVKSWKTLGFREVDTGKEEHILVMELAVDGAVQSFYELALLVETSDGWRYHSAQKLSIEDYPGLPEKINFTHFDRVAEKIRY